MLGDIFSLVLCDFHTVKWCKESIDMVHIKWTLWILIYVVCKKFVFCRKLILKALFRFNGTSKPSLTIALKILKTIEKPLIPMVGPSKNIQWWWSNVVKTIEKPLKSMVAWKKTLTIPSLWKIDHRRGLGITNGVHRYALSNCPETWTWLLLTMCATFALVVMIVDWRSAKTCLGHLHWMLFCWKVLD